MSDWPFTVTSLTGTANQVTVSALTGDITLSLPQSIDTTASPIFGGLRVNGFIGINTAPNTSIGLYQNTLAYTGVAQTGLLIAAPATSAGTTSYKGIDLEPTSAAAAYTVTDMYGYYCGDFTKGAGSSITTTHAFYIKDPPTSATTMYGYHTDMSSGSGRWAFYGGGTAASFFGGTVQELRLGLGTASDASNLLQTSGGSFINSAGALVVGVIGPHAIGGSTSPALGLRITGSWSTSAPYGIFDDQTIVPAAGTSGIAVYFGPTFTEAGSGTHTTLTAVQVQPTITNGAASTTDAIGIDITTFAAGSGTSNAYGIRVAAPTGATNNYALNVVAGRTQLAGTVFVPGLTTSAGLQTAVLCQGSSGEMIADSIACLASSEAFKENLNTFNESALNIVKDIHVRTFNYKAEGIFKKSTPRIGFSAEEVATLHQYLGGYDTEGRLRTIDDRGLLAVVVKAIQEQQIEMDLFQDRLTSLNERFDN